VNLGILEILILLTIVALLFGTNRLTELARFLGKGVGAYKREAGELERLLGVRKASELSVTQGEPPLTIFVSSRIDELSAERRSALNAISKIPVARAWVFEFTPPSSEEVEDSYLRKVEQCDVFILIIGETVSPPVMREYEVARAAGKPCLIFIKDCERGAEADAFVKSLSLKSPRFSTPEGLAHILTLALLDELIRGYREGRHRSLSAADFGILAAVREVFAREGGEEPREDSVGRRRLAEEFRKEGIKRKKAHDYLNAVKFLTQALYLEPSNHKDLSDRGRCYFELGYRREAIADLKKAISIAPGNTKNLMSLAIAYSNEGEAEQAVEICNRVLALEPHGEEAYAAYWIRGHCHSGDPKRTAKVTEDFERALTLLDRQRLLRPSDTQLLHRRGQILCELGRVDEAIRFAERYVAEEPRDTYSHLFLGVCYQLKGDRKRAIKSYEECLSLPSSYWTAQARENLRRLTRPAV